MAHGGFLSGGAAYNQWNVYAAPFAKGLTYSECKQCVQAFIFDANQSLVSKGGQLVFSSLNVEFSVPEFMKDLDAWGPGGVINGKYSDYINEAEMLTEALLEVIEEGDGHGKPQDRRPVRQGLHRQHDPPPPGRDPHGKSRTGRRER